MDREKKSVNVKKIGIIGAIAAFLVFIMSILGILMGQDVDVYQGDLESERKMAGDTMRADVVEIVDGDTIKVRDSEKDEVITVRYLGIDTPELDGEDYETCFAEEAKETNADLVEDKELILEFVGSRSYGRELAYVYTTNSSGDKNEFVNEALLRGGYGRFYLDKDNTDYQEEFMDAAMDAQSEFAGLWGVCGEPQFENKCVIKGNNDATGNKYYHLPEDKYYDETIVNLDKEDKWFCTIEEAEGKNFERAND